MSSRAIDEIEERLQDLGDALREAGSPEIAEQLERHAADFNEPTRVRRSVNTLRAQLERWRQQQSDAELPETAKVLLASNRLEDACRNALAAGVIAAAPASFAAQSRRKLAIALVTLLCGGFALLIPIALVEAGIDFSDLGKGRRLAPVRLPRGEEDHLPISALAEALRPQAVTSVGFEPLGGCKLPLPEGSTCSEAPPRLWAEGRLPTYEIKLRHQAYGLLFSIANARLEAGRLAEGKLLLAATDDTPDGHYEIPITAMYGGYTPQRCELMQRLTRACPAPRVGKGERHAGVPLALVVIHVVPGDPSKRLGEKRLAQAEAEEARRKAEERAQQIAAAVTAIEGVLAETEQLVARRRWEEARPRVQKLGALFEPLEGVALPSEAADAPGSVGKVRARYEILHEKLEAFEQQIFDRTFAAVTAESNRSVPEDRLMQRIAGQFRVTPGYVQEIYTGSADEIQRRIEASSQAHLEQLKAQQQARERKCGVLPKGAWATIDHYVRARYAEPRVEIELGECMTPRLTERDCWELRCDYRRKVEVAVERPKVVTKHTATFYMMQDRITRHHDG